MSEMGFEVTLPLSFDEAVGRVTEALKSEGFGVLTRVDLHEAFREKLGVEFRPYTILGACNPPLAHRAVSARPDVGLLLPCNVTVEAVDGASLVRLIDPEWMMATGGLAGDAILSEVGTEARMRLRCVAEALAGAAGRPND